MANIKVKFGSSNQLQSTSPLTLKNSISSGSATRLDALVDVEEINPQDGAFLVYRSSDDKYVVTSNVSFSLENSTGALDGGSF
jgi:hypothetical protein